MVASHLHVDARPLSQVGRPARGSVGTGLLRADAVDDSGRRKGQCPEASHELLGPAISQGIRGLHGKGRRQGLGMQPNQARPKPEGQPCRTCERTGSPLEV